MEVIADLHLHSKYSRAVSPKMVIPEISRWAAQKGIDLVGAPDWTHPLWFKELKENLVEVKPGIYQAKSGAKVKFLLSCEIESTYSQAGKSHRIHNLVLVPNLETADKINQLLRGRGVNLFSDGRPKTGLSSLSLCELVFSASADCLVIPAHVWTPWYSLYGSRSGFDSLEECFGDYSGQIYAVETGLSSDPAMNWRIAELDSRSIVSFSDAHSPAKLGREATIFQLNSQDFNYQGIKEAIIKQKIASTIEFYPEEGKYHYTGHRACGVVQSPQQTKKLGKTCPVCGRQLTVGVMHRVEQLATRPENYRPGNRPPYQMLVPLLEILAESLNSATSSQCVLNEYNNLTNNFGNELTVLLKTKPEEIERISGERVADGIKKVRAGEIVVEPGYDGVFGTVKIWPQSVDVSLERETQMSLF
jgi:uncharacterized protein (TIGR00375 family)